MAEREETSNPALRIDSKRITIPTWLLPLLLSVFPAVAGYASLQLQVASHTEQLARLESEARAHISEEDHPRRTLERLDSVRQDLDAYKGQTSRVLERIDATLRGMAQNQIRLCEKQRVNCEAVR